MANILVNKFDIVCLSETFLNSKILTDDESLQIFLVAVLLGLITLLIQTWWCMCSLQNFITFEAARYKIFTRMH